MPDFVQFLLICIAVILAIGVSGALAQALRARLVPKTWLRPPDVELAALEERIVARLEARLRALEHAVDATAIEVERIGEAQRYTSGLLPEPGSAAARSAAESRTPQARPGAP
jgi:hypothetical protein